MILEDYQQFGGVYAETAAARNALAYAGVTARHNGEPLSEAMTLGVSGGVGAAYFVFEWKGQTPQVYIGAAHRYKTRFGDIMNRLYERLGVRTLVKRTASPAIAASNVRKALEVGKPAVVHVDMGKLPYYAGKSQYLDHAVVVYGWDETGRLAHVADRAATPLTLSLDDLDGARASVNSLKRRCLTFDPPADPVDLREAAIDGIRACCDAMLHPPKPVNNFGLNAWRKWAALANHPSNPKGWPTVFPRGPRLYAGLRTAFSFAELVQSNRGALRGLYADFLEEAGRIPRMPDFSLPAALFRKAAAVWGGLADVLLPDSAPLLGQVKTLSRQKDRLFLAKGAGALPEMEAINRRLFEIEAVINRAFPLDERETAALLDRLHGHVAEIYHCDSDAVDALRGVMREAGLAAPASSG